MNEVKMTKITTAAGARRALEKEFFQEGVGAEMIRLLDRIEQYISNAFKDGYNMASESEEWSNNACLGYAILGAKKLGYSEEQTKKLIQAIYGQFDFTSVNEAKETYNRSPY